MRKYLTTPLGRLRLLGYLEGVSLLVLVFVAVPMKYVWRDPTLVKTLGPIHGMLFLLFVLGALRVGVEQGWKFRTTTWKVLVACMIPFGTFYIDRAVLRIL
ncbi:DUF3817 domain-containing protein [Puia dinghuensis]|uniref:Membrane protein n=1 Tax=Puia dinghuensis TaxID=1792502 RepID=A0A8J2UJJ2_9BACT|nr:DUF3817 domain-containing protein [Puia dinghuensis]GGB25119.1 membrane protein [Puia dinghuensis]